MKHLAVGIRGWRFAHWLGSFYPEDAPQDWWLTYYGNELRAVFVPSDYLIDATAESVSQWVDDCSAGFEFFVTLDATRPWAAWRELLAPLGEQLSGIVIEAAAPPAALLTQARDRAPVYLSHPPSAEFGLYAACTSIEHVLDLPSDDRPLLACINSEQPIHAKKMRVLLEALSGTDDSPGVGLFFGGDRPALENARQAVILHQLLDWA